MYLIGSWKFLCSCKHSWAYSGIHLSYLKTAWSFWVLFLSFVKWSPISLGLILPQYWGRTLLNPLHNAPWVMSGFCLFVVVLLWSVETEITQAVWTLWIFLSDSFSWVLLWHQIVSLYTFTISTELKSQRDYLK